MTSVPKFLRARAARWAGATALAIAGVFGSITYGPLLAGNPALAQAATSQDQSLTGADVIGALRGAGLVTSDPLQLHTDYGTPSGPPMTEREAWSFQIAGRENGPGGRILVFRDDKHLQAKAAWFRKVGAGVLAYQNVILWLDPDLPASEVSAYRTALQGLR